ncbi:MAG: T9SS type A sorting domain-containing protein, partial [Bacteroidia bacterium]|nr:T9SS type A sorting domain-containing protein [Bacteroidia bacterium]
GGSPVGTGTSFTTPIITVSTPYYVEASNNGCSSARTLVDATINDIPSVTSTTPASRCGSGTVNLIAATSAGSLNWYTAATGGSPVGTGTSFTTPIITVSTPYYVEASNNGCSSARTLVDATINDIPLVTSTTPASRCGSGTVNLIAATSAGSLNWYTAATGGSPVGTGTSFTTPTLISNTFYYVGANNNNCNSTSRTTVLATIVAPPSNSAAGSDMTINCLGSLLMNANNPSIGTGTWYVIAGSGTFASPNSFQSDVTGLSQGTNTFAWTITNNPCMASTDNVDIVLNSTLPTTQIPPITGTYSLNVSFTLSNSMTISSSTVNIGKDVIIKVPSGKTLFIQNSILKACGNDMWGGIEIENGGALEISGSTIISDARFAVTAKEGSLLQINNGVSGTCTFDRCYQGILMPNYSTLKTYSINNVKFKCTSALISPYSGQKTNAGINAHNHVYIDLTNVEFEGLATGILSSGSSIAITGASKFLNSDNAIKAVGGNILIENAMLDNIYNSNTLGKTKAISMLFGNLVLRNSTLSKCETAVYFAKSTAEIRDNTFDDIDAAVYAQSPNYQDVIIESNTISNCSNTGIDLNSVGEANRIMVRFNNISIDNTPAGTSITSYGIKMSSISNLSNVKGNGSIAYNTIVLWTSGEAIGVSGKDYPFVTANTITLKNANSYMQKGVSVSEGRNGVINCNYVNSPGIISNVQNYGLFFSNTKNPIVTCNTSLGSNKGFYFTSPCGNVKLVRNEMSYNNVGLELTGSASIGEQPHYGNFFTGFGTSPDFPYAAFNYTTAFNNRILVYPDLAPVNFRPANNTISNNNTDLWFFGDYSAGERACNGMHYGPLVPLYNLLGDCSSPTPVAVDLEAARTLNLADTIAATDTFPSREFIAETNYELRRQLYETLRADPEKLQNNEIFEEFFDNFNSEPAGQFEEIMAELNEPGPVREQLANDIQQNVSLIEQYSIDILTNIESGNSLLNEALIQNVENLSATNEYFFQLIENEDLLKMQYLRNTNQSIDNQEIMDVNNSIVFEIYATTIEQDIYEFESDQLDKISEVAHQCPQKGGSAVYLARNLYSIAYPNEVYNDVAACISQGYYRLANKNKLSSNVYFHLSPNPTKDDIKASYYFSEDENPFLKIFNGLNQLVKTIPLNASNREQIIKLADLNGGIYFYNLVSNNSLIQEGKIAIIK